MRLFPCLLFVFATSVVASADEFKPEPGFKLIFNGKNLDGWQTKAAGKDGKPMPLEGKTEAYDGRFKVKDGELVYDPKVKGDRYIETVEPVSGDFTIRFDFKPSKGCNNDILFRGSKFDILAEEKNTLKGIKIDEWNTMEIVVKGTNVDYLINGEKAGTRKTNTEKGPFTLRAEFGPLIVKNLRMSDGK